MYCVIDGYLDCMGDAEFAAHVAECGSAHLATAPRPTVDTRIREVGRVAERVTESLVRASTNEGRWPELRAQEAESRSE